MARKPATSSKAAKAKAKAVDRLGLKPYFQANAPAEVSLDLTGIWTNELGSTMTVTASSGDTFSGTYQSSVSNRGSSVTGTLTGVVSGDAVGFLVDWSPLNSMTAWSGLVLTEAGGGVYIYALWNLVTTPPQSSDYWQSIMAGADLFTQLE